MFAIPFDPVMSVLMFIGIFIYCALNGNSSPKRKEMSNEEFTKWWGENSPEYRRYQKWLEDHQ